MMFTRALRSRRNLAVISRWLVALLIAFHAQLALAVCLDPAQNPALAYGMAQRTNPACANMSAANSAACLGHFLQSYQAADKSQFIAHDGLHAIGQTARLPVIVPVATATVSATVAASPPSPPARFLYCCLRI